MIAYGSSNLNRLDVSFADWLREYDHKRMARLCQLRPVVLVWPLKADRLETFTKYAVRVRLRECQLTPNPAAPTGGSSPVSIP